MHTRRAAKAARRSVGVACAEAKRVPAERRGAARDAKFRKKKMSMRKSILCGALWGALCGALVSAAFACGCATQRYALTEDGTRLEVISEFVDGAEKFYVVGEDGARAEISADAVREETVLAPEVKDAAGDVAESALEAASAQGGLLGAIGAALFAVWGLFKNRKAQTALSAAAAVASGVSAVIKKLTDAQASGEKIELTEEDAKALIVAVQNDEKTKEAVKKLLSAVDDRAGGALSKLRDFLF